MLGNKVTLIGDAHGKMGELMEIQRRSGRTIQLGDMGFGFCDVLPFAEKDKFLRGNNDDPTRARAHNGYLGDWGFHTDGFFFISGAESIDKASRTEGFSWWRDEELSNKQLARAIDVYCEVKPSMVFSHECPVVANKELLGPLLVGNANKWYFQGKSGLTHSRTCQAMQAMFEAHQPDLWVFGHYHINRRFMIGRTSFQCLGELQILDVILPGSECVIQEKEEKKDEKEVHSAQA